MILTPEFLILIVSGIILGIFGTVVGGSMFFSAPLFQALFPQVSFGAIVGNIKTGSLLTALGSSYTNRHQINYRQNLKIVGVAFLGTIIGTSIIADISQAWLFPAVVGAVILTVSAPRIAHLITERTFLASCFLIGIYGGMFGAGVGVIMIALLRLQYSKDSEIAYLMIQSRFIEISLHVIAIGIHFLHGNLVAAIWVPWAIGALIGGVVGGKILQKMGKLPGHVQKYILYVAFAFALIVAGSKALGL